MTTITDLVELAHEAIEATERLIDAAKDAYTGPSWPEAVRAVNTATEARRAAWAAWRPSTADRRECRLGREPSDQYRAAEALYQEAVSVEEQAEAVEVAASEHERRLRGWAEAVEAMREFIKEG